MSDRKLTEAEFVAKIDYAGGIIEALGYGLSADDLEDQESDLAQTWRDLERQYADFEVFVHAVEYAIDDFEYRDDEDE